jgi:hypothetical protein
MSDFRLDIARFENPRREFDFQSEIYNPKSAISVLSPKNPIDPAAASQYLAVSLPSIEVCLADFRR